MKARLVARGFINSFIERNGYLFCECALQYGKKTFKYRVLVDKAMTQHFKDIGALQDGVNVLNESLAKQPQVLCIANPIAEIENNQIIYGGVLLGFCALSFFKQGLYDKKIFEGGL